MGQNAGMDDRPARESDEWLLTHTARRTWWHFREGWDAVDARHRARWITTMTAGLVILLLLTIALVFVARALERRGALGWEAAFVETFAQRAPFSFGAAIWIESPGNGVVLWPVVIVASAIAAWRRRAILALTLALGFVLLDVAVLTGWMLWERPRPELVADGAASSGGSFNAFPSGHVSQTIVIYGLLVALWLRQTHIRAEKWFGWLIVAVLALAVAAGRLRLGAHWPTDLIAGAILGTFWLGVLLRAAKLEDVGPPA